MKYNITHVKEAFQKVFEKPFYLILSLIFSVCILLINLLIINYNTVKSFPGLKIIISVLIGAFSFLPLHSVILLFLISILSGIFLSMLFYHINNLRKAKASYATGIGGMFLGILAPSCPACGLGLASLLGLGGMISSLPLGGIEVNLVGAILMIFAVLSISKKINSKTGNTCDVKR